MRKWAKTEYQIVMKILERLVERMSQIPLNHSTNYVSCGIPEFIPYVNNEWASRFDFETGPMGVKLCEILVAKTSDKDNLWEWLFSRKWYPDIELAEYRLNMVINDKQMYDVSTIADLSAIENVNQFKAYVKRNQFIPIKLLQKDPYAPSY